MLKISIRKDLSNLNLLERVVDHNTQVTTRNLAEMLVDDVNANWSGESPSLPYDPPAVVSGELSNSIEIESQGRDLLGRFTGKDGAIQIVRIRADYGQIQEFGSRKQLPRPFMRPAIERLADRVPDEFKNLIGMRML